MISRREALKGIAATTAGFALSSFTSPMAQADQGKIEEKSISPKDAIARLKKGNNRYATMKRLPDPGVGPDARKALTEGQWPYATILCCSDSRVPPEIVFDEGLGKLFVIRVGGNIIAPAILGPVEYACLLSTSRLIVVMGHESCTAVSAAVQAAEDPDMKVTPGIKEVLSRIIPTVNKIKKKTGLQGKELVEAAAKENVRVTVKQIADESEALRGMQSKGEIMIVGAYYSLATGKVDIWA
ncbi:MAG: twin-arginine translocation signal domain-containing protein [Desulfobacterales bacterium]|nr:twin-arginine translocation signal domain-containing protein [Desulfobacterales bacterium]